jgi:hypothetical protein
MSSNPSLPDFDLIRAAHHQLAETHNLLAQETDKLQDLPAISSGAAILDAINNLRQEMNQKMDHQNQKIDDLEARLNSKIDGLQNRQKAA